MPVRVPLRVTSRSDPIDATMVDMAAAICPITQEVMEDPVVCADGHSYERSAIEKWLQTKSTSPSTNAPLLHKNLVPNHALRNLIAEARGVRRPITIEQHALVATPCARARTQTLTLTSPSPSS